MIKKFFKFILGLILSLVALIALYALLNYLSYSKTHYECKGTLKGSDSWPNELFLTLEEYGSFNVFSDSYGRIRIEIPELLPIYYYSHLEDLDNLFHIYEDSPPKFSELKGSFSLLSKDLLLETPFGFFDGRCNKTEL